MAACCVLYVQFLRFIELCRVVFFIFFLKCLFIVSQTACRMTKLFGGVHSLLILKLLVMSTGTNSFCINPYITSYQLFNTGMRLVNVLGLCLVASGLSE